MKQFKLHIFVVLSVLIIAAFSAKIAVAVSGSGNVIVRGEITTPMYPDEVWNYWIERTPEGKQEMFITTHYNSILKMEHPQDSNNERAWWFHESLQRTPNGSWEPHLRGKLIIRNDPNNGLGYIGELFKTDYYYNREWLRITPNLLGQYPEYRGQTLYMRTIKRYD